MLLLADKQYIEQQNISGGLLGTVIITQNSVFISRGQGAIIAVSAPYFNQTFTLFACHTFLAARFSAPYFGSRARYAKT